MSSIRIEDRMFKRKFKPWDPFQGDVFMNTIQ